MAPQNDSDLTQTLLRGIQEQVGEVIKRLDNHLENSAKLDERVNQMEEKVKQLFVFHNTDQERRQKNRDDWKDRQDAEFGKYDERWREIELQIQTSIIEKAMSHRLWAAIGGSLLIGAAVMQAIRSYL